MNAETLNDLKERADEIKEATEAGENTAVRVGGLLRDMLDYDQDQTDAIGTLSSNVLQQPLSGINQMNSSPSEGQSIRFRNNRWEFFVPGEGGGSSSGRQSSYFMNVTHGTTPSLPDPQDYVPANDKFVHGNDEWTSSSPNPGYNEDTWMIWVWFSNGIPLTINGPVLVRDSSTASSNGEDGESIEWIYKRVSEKYTDAEILTLQEFLEDCYGAGYTSPDARPSGWEDHPSGIDSTNKYEYTAYRKSSLDAQGNRIWGETGFVGPILWAAYGDKGTDGDGVEYIYYANNLGYIPMGDDYDPTAWTNDEHFQDPEYIRTVEGTSIQYWSDDPIDLANSDLGQGAIEWVSVRKKQTVNDVTSWQPYSVPAVWSRLAVDGLVEGYTVDLSNQNMPVGTTFKGHAANYRNTCQVTVYHNGVPMNYGTDVGEFTLSIGTITRSDGVAVNGRITANQNFPSNPNDIIVQIDSTGIDDFDSKNAFVPVTVTIYEGLNQTTTRNLTITLFGVAVGEAGKVIDLYTETAAIHTNASGTVIAPAALEVGVRVGTGSDYEIKSVTTAISEGYTFYYYYDSQQSVSTLTENSLKLQDGHTNLHIMLYKNSVRIDEERLPYVKDGDKGDSLTKTTPYYHADASSSFNKSGAVYPSEWKATIQEAGWSATNKYLYLQEKNKYTWGEDWGTISLFRTWINDGQSSYKSTMFVRMNNTPTKPSDSAGSYANPSPTGQIAGTNSDGNTVSWSDGIPSGSNILWATTRIFSTDGESPQQASWETPRQMTDTDTYDVEFALEQNNDATPALPTTNNRHKDTYPYGYTGQVWFDPSLDKYSASGVLRDFTGMYWRAERECLNGVWGDWTILRIKGEQGDGEDGYSLIINPPQLIINESITTSEETITDRDYDNSDQKVTVQIKVGNTPQPLYVSSTTPTCRKSDDSYISRNDISATATGYSTTEITVKIDNIYNTTEGNTITEGYIPLTVGVWPAATTPFAQLIKIPFYINREESTLFGVKGELHQYVANQHYVTETVYTAGISATQKTLRSEYTEQIGRAGDYGRNLFGFHKEIYFDGNGNSCVPFIQGYGIAVPNLPTRIRNLGFDGVGGLFTVTFYAKTYLYSANFTFDLCDVTPNLIMVESSNYTSYGYAPLSTTWKKVTLHFDIPETNSFITTSNYNGFFDVEKYSGSASRMYIRHLLIERGQTAHDFYEADEDIAYIGQGQLIPSLDIDSPSISIGEIDGYKNVYYTPNAIDPSSFPSPYYIDYIHKDTTFNLVANKIYTLSYWAKASSSGFVITNFLYKPGENIITYVIGGGDLYTAGGNGSIKEGVTPDGSTNVILTNSWKQYFIRFYVANNIPNASLLVLRVTKTQNLISGSSYRSAQVYMRDVQLQEGYVIDPTYFNSVIGQTARKLSLVQQTGLKKAGIDIENGEIKLTADNVGLSIADDSQMKLINFDLNQIAMVMYSGDHLDSNYVPTSSSKLQEVLKIGLETNYDDDTSDDVPGGAYGREAILELNSTNRPVRKTIVKPQKIVTQGASYYTMIKPGHYRIYEVSSITTEDKTGESGWYYDSDMKVWYEKNYTIDGTNYYAYLKLEIDATYGISQYRQTPTSDKPMPPTYERLLTPTDLENVH